MNEYFQSNGLNLNFSKTKFMVLRNNDLVELPSEITVNDIKIDRVASHKFLGILVDEKFKLKEHFQSLIEKLIQSCRALSIIRHHLPRELLIQFYHAHFMSHIYYCSFLYIKFTKEEIMRIQRLQNRCIKIMFNLDSRHSTIDLFTSFDHKSLPVIGIIYAAMIINTKKSLLLNMEELLDFEIYSNNRRSSGNVIPSNFSRKRCIGTDISYLGPILFNQLPKELKEMKNLNKFKVKVKSYLLEKIDLLMAPEQLKTHRIA